MTLSARAPGKAMLFGEYAVLEGAPGLVTAVDRYAVATLARDAARSPFVDEALAAARTFLASRGLAVPEGSARVDSSQLYAQGARRKLGLGSSAAVTVASFGAAVLAGGGALDDVGAIFTACEAAHARAQGVPGSGADIAVAVRGGTLAYQRAPGGATSFPVTLRDDCALTLVDSGAPASTGDRLARLFAIRDADPARYRALLRPLAELAAAVAGLVDTEGAIPIEAVVEWNRALGPLEQAIGLPILTDSLRAIDDAARSVTGAAKPSGAGGGDLAVCVTPAAALPDLRAALARAGFSALPIALGARGLHVCPAQSEPSV